MSAAAGVLAGLVPAIHAIGPGAVLGKSESGAAWMAGTSPAKTAARNTAGER